MRNSDGDNTSNEINLKYLILKKNKINHFMKRGEIMKFKFNIMITALFSFATIIAGTKEDAIEKKLALEAQKTIEIDGSIYRISETENIKVIKTSGHLLLDQAAQNAVKLWKFEPAHRAGVPVSGFVNVPVIFKFKN